jgi:hypothetical protein
MNDKEKILDKKTKDLMLEFCPFNFGDMQAIVETIESIGKSTNDAYDMIINRANEINEGKFDNIDPVYCVYDALKDEAIKELKKQINLENIVEFDFDLIEVYGNYLCTSLQIEDETKQELIKILKSNNINFENSSALIIWFLDCLDINKNDLTK